MDRDPARRRGGGRAGRRPRLTDAELRANLLRFLAAVAEAGWVTEDLDALAPPAGFDVDAALAAALADDEILAALADPAATDEWFDRRPPQLRARIRFRLVAAAIDRVEEPDRLLPAALAIAAVASARTVSSTGALLRVLFAGQTGDALSPPQRRYLRARHGHRRRRQR